MAGAVSQAVQARRSTKRLRRWRLIGEGPLRFRVRALHMRLRIPDGASERQASLRQAQLRAPLGHDGGSIQNRFPLWCPHTAGASSDSGPSRSPIPANLPSNPRGWQWLRSAAGEPNGVAGQPELANGSATEPPPQASMSSARSSGTIRKRRRWYRSRLLRSALRSRALSAARISSVSLSVPSRKCCSSR